MSKGGTPSIPNPWTIKLGSDGSTVHIDTDLDNIHIAEIAPINVNSTLAVTEPIVTQSTSSSDSKVDLKVEPLSITSDSNSVVDLKPVAVDSCQTIKIAPLPPIRMEQPYSQHFGFTFMGMELFGFTTSGRYETLLNDPAKPTHASCNCHSHEEPHVSSRTPQTGSSGSQEGGLRVCISGNR
jgi:hypothetical protein